MLFADPLPALADAELDYLPGWVDAALAERWLHALSSKRPGSNLSCSFMGVTTARHG